MMDEPRSKEIIEAELTRVIREVIRHGGFRDAPLPEELRLVVFLAGGDPDKVTVKLQDGPEKSD